MSTSDPFNRVGPPLTDDQLEQARIWMEQWPARTAWNQLRGVGVDKVTVIADALGFAPPWQEYDATGPWGKVRIRKDQFGYAHLNGLVEASAAASASATQFMFQLGIHSLSPEPGKRHMFACPANGGIARVDISGERGSGFPGDPGPYPGVAIYMGMLVGTLTDPAWIALDSISWRTFENP